jgi:hypothetical protein
MNRAEPGWLVLALAGLAALISSFLPFYTFRGGTDLTVWSRGLFPTATLIPLLVFVLGLEALFVLLMGYEPRSPFLNFTWEQARLVGGVFAIVLALCYLVQSRAGGHLGSGYFILLLASLATFAAGVMTRRAQLARGREEPAPVEHPWRGAVIRWRAELTEKAKVLAGAGTTPVASEDENADEKPDGKPDEKDEEKDDEKPGEKPEETAPVARLSAVQPEPDGDTEAPRKPATPRKATKKAADTLGDAPSPTDGEAQEAKDDGGERERPAAPG